MKEHGERWQTSKLERKQQGQHEKQNNQSSEPERENLFYTQHSEDKKQQRIRATRVMLLVVQIHLFLSEL